MALRSTSGAMSRITAMSDILRYMLAYFSMSESCCSVKMMLSEFICGGEALVKLRCKVREMRSLLRHFRSAALNALCEQVVKRYGMVLDNVEDGGVEVCENLRRCRYKRALGAVAASEVLRGNDGDGVAAVGAHQQDFGMIVGEKGSVDNLDDEAPELDGLVGGLVVEHEVKAANRAFLFEEEKSAQKFFGY
nr:MAG TPA: hypothetical protein [Caudoviricetes sp.]